MLELRPVEQWRQWWRDTMDPDDPVLATASQQGFVLRTAELPALGVSRGQARWAVATGRWARPAHGMVAPVDVRRDLPDSGADFVVQRRWHALVAAAAALARPGEVATGRSGAIMQGLPTYAVPPRAELTSRTPSGMGRRPTAHLYAATLDSLHMSRWFGIEVSTIARTLVDLARHDARDAIMAADAALREGLVSADEIATTLQWCRQWPGIRRAREVLALADPRAESPLESLTRLVLHDAGLPPPALQVWIGGDRVDFFWPQFGLVLEADGRIKYTAEERWAEKQREQRLRRHVRQVERVTWHDVTGGWNATYEVLRSAMR